MLYLKCSCGRAAEYANDDDARADGWTWTGSTLLSDVTCGECRQKKEQRNVFMLVRRGNRPIGFVDGINARDARTTARSWFGRGVVCIPVQPEQLPDNPWLIGCVSERRRAQIREDNRRRWGE